MLDLVVRDVHERRAESRVQLREFGAHVHAQLRIEVARLVHQEHVRMAHHRAAERHPLTLPARLLDGDAAAAISSWAATASTAVTSRMTAARRGDLVPRAAAVARTTALTS